MTKAPWNCTACGEADPARRIGRALYCIDCKEARSIYRTTEGNLRSGFNRTNKGSPSLEITIDEFCRWRRSQTLACAYCKISQTDLRRVGMKSQVQRPMRTLGVDRVDSSGPYVEANLAPCCFVCNQIKGDRFSAAEMRVIGAAVAQVWAERLAVVAEDVPHAAAFPAALLGG